MVVSAQGLFIMEAKGGVDTVLAKLSYLRSLLLLSRT